jgi:hypothetical protein
MLMNAAIRRSAPDVSLPPVLPAQETHCHPDPTWQIRLVNKQTGDYLRLNGRTFAAYAKNPEAALSALMERRDPAKWEPELSRLPPRLRVVEGDLL